MTTQIRCSVIKKSESTGKEVVFRNCDNVEQAISIINNRTFNNNPINEGTGLSFTSHTENNLYFIKATPFPYKIDGINFKDQSSVDSYLSNKAFSKTF